MKKLLLLFLLFLLSNNSYADAICNDGWISKSSGSGTCSWHGGVKKWLNNKKPSDIYMEYIYSPSDGVSGKCKGTYQQKKSCRNAREMIRRQMEYIDDADSKEERNERFGNMIKSLSY